MNILYLGYWNVNDPLTIATIFPGLRVLRELYPKATLVFVNIQREPLPIILPDIFKELEILYNPLQSGNRLIDKIRDFWKGPETLENICGTNKIARVIARGAPAGALAYLLWKRNKIPFLVESFEPHAEYMLESNVWSKMDLRYIMQSHWEIQQKKYAAGLMPVTVNYQNQLIDNSVSKEKIKFVPCVVDESKFAFNKVERKKLRDELRIGPTTIVGLYAGKYDGLYLAEETFKLYKIFFDQIRNFQLIILSPEEYHTWINNQIVKYKLPASGVFVKHVKHPEVANYCSASDFAFATYKPGASKAYLSPVKLGEYWVNGLPVILTSGVGDESSMIQNGFGGVLFDVCQINPASLSGKIDELMGIMKSANSRETISRVGIDLRSIEKLKLAYRYFLLER